MIGSKGKTGWSQMNRFCQGTLKGSSQKMGSCGQGEMPVIRVSKSCHHAITQLCNICENLGKSLANESYIRIFFFIILLFL